jgi:hypothetical protein
MQYYLREAFEGISLMEGPFTELGTSPLNRISSVSGGSLKDKFSVEGVRDADIHERGKRKKQFWGTFDRERRGSKQDQRSGRMTRLCKSH